MAINIPIISEFDGKGINKAIAQFKQLETTGEKAQFAIKKAAVPAGLAVAALGGFLVKAAKGAEEARQANQRLANVLDSMGFKEATDRVSAYAESLEKSLAVDADVIKATQTKLATFGKLTQSVNEAGGAFDRATVAAIDMAAAGFGSAETNAVALGKALEDPIKGITALAKSGVTFTEQEKDKIKVLVASNKLLEAQDMVLAAIEKQVGGTAKASASSFDKMKYSLAGISDTFGELVLPAIDKFAIALAGVAVFVQQNEKLVGILVMTIGGLAATVLVVNAAMKVYQATLLIVKAAQIALNLVMAVNPFVLMAAGIAVLILGLVAAYNKFEWFRDGVKTIVNSVIGFFNGMVNAVTGAVNAIISAYNSIPLLPDIPKAPTLAIPQMGGAAVAVPNAQSFAPPPGVIKSAPKTVTKAPAAKSTKTGMGLHRFADGGIITAPVMGLVGEAGPEAIIPLDQYNRGNGNVTINVTGGLATSAEIGESVVNALRAYSRSAGPLQLQVA
jgi:hypothetical protein